MLKALLLAAFVTLVSGHSLPRCVTGCEDYVPIKIGTECIVIWADGPNTHKEYILGLGDCKDAVNFFYGISNRTVDVVDGLLMITSFVLWAYAFLSYI